MMQFHILSRNMKSPSISRSISRIPMKRTSNTQILNVIICPMLWSESKNIPRSLVPKCLSKTIHRNVIGFFFLNLLILRENSYYVKLRFYNKF